MHVTLDMTRNLRRTLRYHERKKERGVAEILGGGNLIADPRTLSFKDFRYHFERLIDQNEAIWRQAMHCIASFSHGKAISNETMKAVGDDWVREFGFGEQPYLLIRHRDSETPHMHIVMGHIREGGKPIRRTLREFYRSKEICQHLEKTYGLQPSLQPALAEERAPQIVRKVVPGEGALHPAIERVLDKVIDHYSYTCFEELNAILGLYNVKANPVRAEQQEGRGLYYQLLVAGKADQDRHFVGGSFPGQPTIDKLEKRFAKSLAERRWTPYDDRLMVTVERSLLQGKTDLAGLGRRLVKEQVSLVTRFDKAGNLEAVCYVDHFNKTAIDGKSLGPQYDATGLTERCVTTEALQLATTLTPKLKQEKRQTQNIISELW